MEIEDVLALAAKTVPAGKLRLRSMITVSLAGAKPPRTTNYVFADGEAKLAAGITMIL